MFEKNDLQRFELGGQSYPYKCDLAVLEKIQDRTGDLLIAEDKLRGFKPRIDADGIMDRTTGTQTLPDVSLVVDMILWMIEEGIDITGEDIKVPDRKTLLRQEEYSLIELSLIPYNEFERCLTPKKPKKEKASQTKTK